MSYSLIIGILETAKLNIGTRFHMALFSLAADIPTVAFCLDEYYSRKFQGLEDLFHRKSTLHFETFCVDDIWETIARTRGASDSSIAWREKVKKKLLAYYHVCWRGGVSIERIRFYCNIKKYG